MWRFAVSCWALTGALLLGCSPQTPVEPDLDLLRAQVEEGRLAPERSLVRDLCSLAIGVISSAPDQALELAQEALAHAQALDWEEGRIEARVALSRAQIRLGRFREAIEQLHKAREQADRLGDTKKVALIELQLFFCHAGVAEKGRAAEALDKAAPLLQRSGTRAERCELLLAQGILRQMEYRLADAMLRYEQGLELGRGHVAAELIGRLEFNRGTILFLGGDYDGAERAVETAMQHFGERGDQRMHAHTLAARAEIANIRGDQDRALHFHAQGIDVAREAGLAGLHALHLRRAARLRLDKGYPDAAYEGYAESLAIVRLQGNQEAVASSAAGVAIALCELGRAQEADTYLSEAKDAAARAGMTPTSLRVSEVACEVYGELGHFREAYAEHVAYSGFVSEMAKEGRVAIRPLREHSDRIERELAHDRLVLRIGIAVGSLIVLLTLVLLKSLRTSSRLNRDLRSALDQVQRLKGLLPICSHCKSIRDDQGFWQRVEAYVSDHSEAEFSHSICPMCAEQHYGPYLKEAKSPN